ncbi:MAG: hypothetical protein WKF92_11380 [Pyrinomonadaceae bacterium]
MKFKSTLLIAIILTFSTFASAQKADPPKSAAVKLPAVSEILAKYVKAIGGREAHEKIKTRMMTGTVEMVPMGIKGTFETYTAAEGKAYTKMNLAGIGEIIEVTDGKSAWTVNPIQGSREKTGAELAQTKLSGNFYRDINIDKLYQKLEVKGMEKVGTKDAYVIVASTEGIPADTFYFDTVSGLLIRGDSTIISPEGNQPVKVFIEEIRAVDGVSIPVKTRTQLTQFEIIMNVTEVKNGVVIDDSKFTKPKQ